MSRARQKFTDLSKRIAQHSPLNGSLRLRDEDAPVDNANEVIPGVWLGNAISSTDREFFADAKIRAVLNCTTDTINTFASPASNGVEYLRIPIEDNLEVDQIMLAGEYLTLGVEFIRKWATLKNEPVLVHCWAGRQRSAAMVVAYLIKYHNMDLPEAIQFVLNKRPEVFHFGLSINFEAALTNFAETTTCHKKKCPTTKSSR